MATSAELVEPSPAREAPRRRQLLLVGNPNVGKTQLFNRLCRQSARVGNYPGITVERRSARLQLSAEPEQQELELVDVPGCYSLNARSAEEQIALCCALGLNGQAAPDLVVVVLDSTQLVRNLYLAVQLAELRVPMILVANMADEAEDNPPNIEQLSELFGVPAVSVSARDGRGLEALRTTIETALRTLPVSRVHVSYPSALIARVDEVAEQLPESWRGSVERNRALALWALSSFDGNDELDVDADALRAACRQVQEQVGATVLDDLSIEARYAFLDAQGEALYGRCGVPPKRQLLSERIDRILLNPVAGFAAFASLMLIVFQALFSWSDPAIGWVEAGVSALQGFVGASLPEGVLRDLLTEGVIGGVGNVVVFLPQILLLFLFIGLLEDSGYMARVAYLMDRVMRAMGLHGRAFVPMLSGFACAVPAILATRTMERSRDRLLTMLVVPLMTCSARLPVYTLIIAALFPPTSLMGWIPLQGLLMVGLYLFSTCVALIAAGVLGRTLVRGRSVPLLLELPPYRLPDPKVTLSMMLERASVFLREAGTVILLCTIGLWVLLSYPAPDPTPTGGPVPAPSADRARVVEAPAHPPPTGIRHESTAGGVRADAAPLGPVEQPASSQAPSAIAHSWGGRLGHWLEPALAPLGFDWRIGVGLVGSFAAREVFVSTMALVYGIDGEDAAAPLRDRIRAARGPDGTPRYTPLVGLSLLVFFALSCQCMSTLAVVRRETRSWRWPAFMFAYMTTLAWLVSFTLYQGGRLLGFA